MGKLQIRRGAQVPAQLASGEPFFDGNDLHIGKLPGAGGNQKIEMTGAAIKTKLESLTANNRLDASAIKNLPEGGGGTTTLIEWVSGESKPTIEGNVLGDFVEGYWHLCQKIGDTTLIKLVGYNKANDPVSIEAETANVVAVSCFTDDSFLVVLSSVVLKFSPLGVLDENYVVAIPVNFEIMSFLKFDAFYILGGSLWDGEVSVGGVVKIFNDGTLDNQFAVNTTDFKYISCLSKLSDGSIVIGGVNLSNTGKLIKANLSGVIDTVFAGNLPSLTDKDIAKLGVMSDDSIIVVGDNLATPGLTDDYLMKISSTGSAIESFSTNVGSFVFASLNAIAIDEDDNIYIAINLTELPPRLLKYSAAGIQDPIFSGNGVDLHYLSITLNNDAIIVECNDMYIWHIKKYGLDGIEDADFGNNNQEALNSVNNSKMTVQSSGNIVIAGRSSSGSDSLIIVITADGNNLTHYSDINL